MSRTWSKTECNYPTVEKEATSIIEPVRNWGHFLYGKPFTLRTDQHSCLIKAVEEKSRMLKSKHGEPNLACMRTMCNIAQEVKMQLQMRCLEYMMPLVALVIHLGCMNFGASRYHSILALHSQ